MSSLVLGTARMNRGHILDLSSTAKLPNLHVSAHDTSKELGESSDSLIQVGSSSLCTDVGLLMKNGKDLSKLPDSHKLEILRSEPNCMGRIFNFLRYLVQSIIVGRQFGKEWSTKTP